MVLALGLDLGTTRIKLLALDASGRAASLWAMPAPPMQRRGLHRTSDPREYLARAEALIAQADVASAIPLGISSQRSSFLVWDKATGEPRTPLISWQDMRARHWCARQAHWASMIWDVTGLPLAPNYAGPKLALLWERDANLRRAARRGSVLFGTLESYLIWNWTGGVHRTDISMAARTLLVDLAGKNWNPELAACFKTPRTVLPEIGRSWGFALESRMGHPIAASMADQTGGAVPVLSTDPDTVYINGGTGSFVMVSRARRAQSGILTALVDRMPSMSTEMLWEGPVNAGARIVRAWTERTGGEDPEAGSCFVIPDEGVVAAPFWFSIAPQNCGSGTGNLDAGQKAWCGVQGLVFRIRQVVDAMCDDQAPRKIVLSGGLSGHDGFCRVLAAVLETEIHILKERELGGLGAAWAAAGASVPVRLSLRPVIPDRKWADLAEKYHRWDVWMRSVMDAAGAG